MGHHDYQLPISKHFASKVNQVEEMKKMICPNFGHGNKTLSFTFNILTVIYVDNHCRPIVDFSTKQSHQGLECLPFLH